MAIYHLSAKPISRSAGRSSTGAAAYRAGQEITDERTGLVFDYRKKRSVVDVEILAPANAPAWVYDRSKLWNAVEHSEKRKDSQVVREVEVALPIELNLEQQKALVRSFARAEFVDAGMVADIAIHHAKRENPHAHILLTMRDISPDGFGQKNRSWNDKALLQNWREAWEAQTNRALEMAGQSVRIDHRTLVAQGIDREPARHLGPTAIGYERRTGEKSEIRLRHERDAASAASAAAALREVERYISFLNNKLNEELNVDSMSALTLSGHRVPKVDDEMLVDEMKTDDARRYVLSVLQQMGCDEAVLRILLKAKTEDEALELWLQDQRARDTHHGQPDDDDFELGL